MTVSPERILLTGAGGIVGTGIRPFIRAAFPEVVLLDLRAPHDVAANEQVIVGDANDRAVLAQAMEGVTGVVHLACAYDLGISFEDTFETNYRGLVATLEAFVAARGSHFVFASSHHGWGYYPRGEVVSGDAQPRPDGWYGVSKVFGEAAIAHLADSYSFSALSVRMGNIDRHVADERRTHMWMSFRDVAAVIVLGLRRPDPGHLAVFATADCADPFFDNSGLRQLGYAPLDRPEDNLATPDIASQKPLLGIAGEAVGGGYAATNFRGDIKRWRKGFGK